MDAGKLSIEQGAEVWAGDDRLGAVAETVTQPESGRLAYLIVKRAGDGEALTVPADLIERVPSPREVRLRAAGHEPRAAGAPASTVGATTGSAGGAGLRVREVGDAIHIAVAEERLAAAKREVDLGELRVHKRVETVPASVRVTLRRDDLDIERVPRHEVLEAPREPHHEGEYLVIPVMKEVLVVEKRLLLTEEIRIRKREVVETQELVESVRRERVELEDATHHGLSGLSAVHGAARPGDTGR